MPYRFENTQTLYRVEQYRLSKQLEPYRIGYFSIENKPNKVLLMRNFLIPDYPNFSTAKHLPELDTSLEYNSKRNEFYGRKFGTIAKGDKLVMVSHELTVDNSRLTILDRGYDMATEKLLWGSDFGAFELIKEKNYGRTS